MSKATREAMTTPFEAAIRNLLRDIVYKTQDEKEEIMKNKTLWKSMKAGMLSGSGDIGPWKIGEWRKHDAPLEMCESGFHASVQAIDAMQYVNCEVLALVEVKGKHLKQDDKQVWESMRVVKAYEWTKPDSVAMSIYCAELVIGVYEKRYPDDKRPRQAIEAAKAWLENPTEENRQASAAYAYDAAYAAAYAASAAAAYAAAAYAASAAASDAAAAYAASAARKGTLKKCSDIVRELYPEIDIYLENDMKGEVK